MIGSDRCDQVRRFDRQLHRICFDQSAIELNRSIEGVIDLKIDCRSECGYFVITFFEFNPFIFVSIFCAIFNQWSLIRTVTFDQPTI